MQILVRCNKPALLASRLFQQDHVVEARIHDDGKGLLVRTRDADGLYLLLNRVILESGLEVETVAPADEDVNSVYQYLIGGEGGQRHDGDMSAAALRQIGDRLQGAVEIADQPLRLR